MKLSSVRKVFRRLGKHLTIKASVRIPETGRVGYPVIANFRPPKVRKKSTPLFWSERVFSPLALINFLEMSIEHIRLEMLRSGKIR